MSICLGNLTVTEIEKRLGITLTDDERDFFDKSHQAKAGNIADNKWHCFDIPFSIVCGSMDFAKKVHGILKPYEGDMIGNIGIALEGGNNNG